MLSLSETFISNKNYVFLFAALAFLAAAILLMVISQLGARWRSRLPHSSRARVPRLGLVDAFDLDRQRQLVIVRRDNVEHLLMIGGPNDLVIESQIIRAEGRDLRDIREAKLKDKEFREKEPPEIAPLPVGPRWVTSGEVAPAYSPNRQMPFPRVGEPIANGHRSDLEGTDQVPTPVSSAQKPFIFPILARRATSPLSSQKNEKQHEPQFTRSEPASQSAPISKSPGEFRRASIATPYLRSSLNRQREGAGVSLTPSNNGSAGERPLVEDVPLPIIQEELAASEIVGEVTPLGVETIVPPVESQEPQSTSKAGGQDPQSSDKPANASQLGFSLDLLETEMAKLLGRD